MKKHWCWKQGGHGGTCHPDFLKRGHRGAPCYEDMYLDLSITSDDNAMLSGSDGQNCQSGGGVFVGLGGPHSIKYLL